MCSTLAIALFSTIKLPEYSISPTFLYFFSLSPVIQDSFTSQYPSIIIESVTTWLPGLNKIRSSKTISFSLIFSSLPSLITVILDCDIKDNLSVISFDLISCIILIEVLANITNINNKFLYEPVSKTAIPKHIFKKLNKVKVLLNIIFFIDLVIGIVL